MTAEALITTLEKKYNLQPLHRLGADEVAKWARPQSCCINDNGQLITLNLSGCGLTQFELTPGMEHLEKLVLTRNALARFELNLEMPQLQLLDISYNEADLTVEMDATLQSLEFLYIYKSNLKDLHFNKGLPEKLAADSTNLNLQENEALNAALKAVFELDDLAERRQRLESFFRAAKRFGSSTQWLLKLILLGNTRAGKTTLHDILTGNRLAEGPGTHGVNIFSHPVTTAGKTVAVQGFDFGGQDYYHNTHYSFFEKDALYVLVWGRNQPDKYEEAWKDPDNDKARPETIYPLRYWMGCLPGIVGAEKKELKEMPAAAPGVKAAEEAAELKPEDKRLYLLQNLHLTHPQPVPLNEAMLLDRHPLLNSFSTWCLKNQQHREEVKKWLEGLVENHAQQQQVLSLDEKAAEWLAKQRDEKKRVVISLKELRQRVPELKSEPVKETTLLATRLHSLLKVFYRSVFDLGKNAEIWPVLASHLVIDLTRFSTWIYIILEKKLASNGYFTEAAAMKRLQAKNETEAVENFQYLLAFMLQEKIIFKAPQREDRYFAPAYLTNELTQPEQLFLSVFEPALVKYEFKGFYHTSILSQLLAGYFDHLLEDQEKDGDKTEKPDGAGNWRYLLWKNKILLYDEAVGGGAQTRRPEKMLYISFETEEEKTADGRTEQRPMMQLRPFNSNAINQQFLKKLLLFVESILIRYEYTQWLRSPSGGYIPYDELMQNNQTSSGAASPLVYYNNILYRKGDFKLFLPDNSPTYAMKKLFISYSKTDLPLVNRFLQHLEPLRRDGLLESWYCTELMPGSDWNATIQAHFAAADMVCFMVSPNFAATDYIYDYEIKKAFERLQKEKDSRVPVKDRLKIIPIILEFCSWQGGAYRLSEFTALPYTAKPISDFDNPDMAWYMVVECLKIMLQNFEEDFESGDNFDKHIRNHKQLMQLFERVVGRKVDKNTD